MLLMTYTNCSQMLTKLKNLKCSANDYFCAKNLTIMSHSLHAFILSQMCTSNKQDDAKLAWTGRYERQK